MARIRIKCAAPEWQGEGILCAMMPSLGDCEVYAVRDDGAEELLTDVTRVTWDSGSGLEVCSAMLHIAAPEIDVLAFVADAPAPIACELCAGTPAYPGFPCPACRRGA